ncbi:MAG: glycosyltransferase family 39 protein [Actinomycetota bacterium]|nr:glycosyltransferase family 39 protein [Actinomycetota bacterium]
MPAIAGMVALTAATTRGLYVSPDSVFYVGTARNLLDGVGFRPPPGLQALGHFPPMFTLVIAAVARLGVDPLGAARLVNIAVLGATVILVGLVLQALTGSPLAALVGAAVTAMAVDVLTFSGSALSEPLFVVLAVGGLVVLAAYLDSRRTAVLVGAAALVALAVLTRYVGVALVVTAVGALVWRGRERRLHGMVDAALFAAIALAPVAAWLAWAGRRGPADERTVAFHLFDRAYLGQAPRPLARWVVPWPGPPVGPVLALVLVVAAVVVLGRPRSAGVDGSASRSLRHLPLLLGAFAVSYLVVLVADRVLIDASGRLDARFLMPLHVVGILLAVPWVWARRGRTGVTAVAGVVVLAQLTAGTAWAAGGVTDTSISRRGYTAAAWRRSAVVARLAPSGLEAPAVVYSNGFDAVFFLTGRVVDPIPAEKDYLTGRPNLRFPEELAAMGADLSRTGGLLVYFDAITARRSFLPSRQELERALPLEVVATDQVGTIYRIRS